jgi:hypothetical protein
MGVYEAGMLLEQAERPTICDVPTRGYPAIFRGREQLGYQPEYPIGGGGLGATLKKLANP